MMLRLRVVVGVVGMVDGYVSVTNVAGVRRNIARGIVVDVTDVDIVRVGCVIDHYTCVVHVCYICVSFVDDVGVACGIRIVLVMCVDSV